MAKVGKPPPEARLLMGCVGGILLPVRLFWFAWTYQPHAQYMVFHGNNGRIQDRTCFHNSGHPQLSD